VEGERRRRRLRRSSQPASEPARPAPPDAGRPGPAAGPADRAGPGAGRGARPDPAERGARPDPAERGARPEEPHADTAAVQDPEPDPARSNAISAEEREAERGLRGLVGSGTSQVRTGAALRARDAARPTEADLAAAEEQLIIVRRNWVPRDDLPRGR